MNFPGDQGNHSRQTSPNPDANTRENSAETENVETAFQGREWVLTTSLITAIRKIPSKDETNGFITKTSQDTPLSHKLELTCKAPTGHRPSAPYLERNPFCGNRCDQPYYLRDNNEPFCLQDAMGNDKFATIRKAQ